MTFIVNKLSSEHLLRFGGVLLDLGCGEGGDAIAAAKIGMKVTAIDKSPESIVKLQEAKGDLDIDARTGNIEDFSIEESSYDAIIANNSLPFLSKNACKEVMLKCVVGLKSGGVFYLSIFGDRDEWSTRESMNFWKEDEIVDFLEKTGLKIRLRITEEGIGQTRMGKEKFWHVYRFILLKSE